MVAWKQTRFSVLMRIRRAANIYITTQDTTTHLLRRVWGAEGGQGREERGNGGMRGSEGEGREGGGSLICNIWGEQRSGALTDFCTTHHPDSV